VFEWHTEECKITGSDGGGIVSFIFVQYHLLLAQCFLNL
jgi:hypothetical protein